MSAGYRPMRSAGKSSGQEITARCFCAVGAGDHDRARGRGGCRRVRVVNIHLLFATFRMRALLRR